MVDRISSAMIPLSAIANLAQAQQQIAQASQQSSTQTKATDLAGYGADAANLVSTERLVSRSQSFLAAAGDLKTRMSMQDLALGQAADQVSKLKTDLIQNLSLGSGAGIRADLESTFSVLKQAMNTNVGGKYLFGGTLNDRPPVTAATVNDLAANPLTSSIQQGAKAQTVQIEEGNSLQTGLVASDVVTNAMSVIQSMTQTDNGTNGPFGTTLTAAQTTAITTAVNQLTDVYNGLLSAQSQNGQLAAQVDAASTRQQSQLDTLTNAVGDITNVDLAAVAVKLNQAQYAYNASASVFATVKGLSLLNFLPTG